jgi:hypothetical protein
VYEWIAMFKNGCTRVTGETWIQRANVRVWNGNIRHCPPQNVQNSIVSRESDVDNVLGFTRANFGKQS